MRSKFSRRTTSLHGASFGATVLGNALVERAQLRQHLELVEQALRGFYVHQPVNTFGDLVEPVDAQRQRHAPLAAELVDEHLVTGMALDVLEEQRRPAGSVLSLESGAPSFERSLLEGWERAPILLTRSVISVISSSGETSSRMRRSSPCFSSVLIQSRRSSYAKDVLLCGSGRILNFNAAIHKWPRERYMFHSPKGMVRPRSTGIHLKALL